MAYENFKPIVWSKQIQHQLEKFTVLQEDCDYQFEGDVQAGGRVKILGVAWSTIGDYDGTNIGLTEVVADSSC